MVSCRCNFKKGRCETHPNTCRVHCLVCNPLSRRRKRGGQTQSERGEPSQPKRRNLPTRQAVQNITSLAEVDEDDGLDESDADVVYVENQWDGTHTSLLRFLQLEHLRKYMPKGDYRNGGGSKGNLGVDTWDKYIRAIRRVVRNIFETMVPDGAHEALKDLARQIGSDNPGQNPVVKSLCQHAVNSKKGSIERRTLYAAFSAVLSEREIVKAGNRVGVKMPKMDSRAHRRARLDSAMIMSSKPLDKTVIRRKRFNEGLVKEALRFLLSEEYVGVLSWGTKKVKLTNDDIVELPSLVRKKTRTNMFTEYCEWFRENHGEDANHLPRTAVFEILGLVTNGQKRALTAVNTMLGNLIYENFIIVDRIIDYYTRPFRQRELRLHAVLTSNFLKNQYMKHVVRNDPEEKVCTHGIEYALSRKKEGLPNKLSMDCNGCKFVPFFFEELRNEVKEAGMTYMSYEDEHGEEEVLGEEHATTAINRCEKLVNLWCGHCARVANQRNAIAELHKRLGDDAKQNRWRKPREVVAIMDFKMKYQPKYYRQTAIEHFGKRGTSWHGFLVLFYVWNPLKQDCQREHVYCDQILQGSNLQDGYAVAAFLEAFLLQLKAQEMFTDLERITVQSDNASCYHSKELILALPYIGMATGVTIDRYIHTETSDGKCLIDAHFAMGMKHVDRYIAEGNNAASPREVFLGLASASGIPNSFAQLVEIDRGLAHLRSENLSKVLEGLSIVTRQNEMVFTPVPSNDDTGFNRADPYSWDGVIRMETWEFSLTSAPVVFVIDVRNGKVTLESGNVEDVCQATNDVDNQDGDDHDSDNDSGDDRRSLNGDEHEVAPQVDPDRNNLQADQSVIGNDTPATVANNDTASFGARVTHYTSLGKLRHEKRFEKEMRNADEEARLRVQGGIFGVNAHAPTDQDNGDSSDDSDFVLHGESDDSETSESSVEGGNMMEPERRDLIAFAVHFTSDLINDPNSPILLREGTLEQPEYMLAANFNVSNHLKERGFGRRPRSGVKYGATNAKPYRKAIAFIVQNEGADKQHRSWILDKLKETEGFQHRLDLPSTEDVNKELKRCIRWKRNAAAEGNFAPNLVELMKDVLDPLQEVYSNYIDEYLDQDLDNSPYPRVFIEIAIKHFSQTEHALKDDELKSRVKNIYTSRRSARKAKAKNGRTTRPRRQQGKSVPNITGRYKDFVTREINENNAKPMQCWQRLCEEFTDANGDKPADFPEKDKALTFIRNWRSKHMRIVRPAAPAVVVTENNVDASEP